MRVKLPNLKKKGPNPDQLKIRNPYLAVGTSYIPHLNKSVEFSQRLKKGVSCLPPREVYKVGANFDKNSKHTCSGLLKDSLYIHLPNKLNFEKGGWSNFTLMDSKALQICDSTLVVLRSPKGCNHNPIDALTRQ